MSSTSADLQDAIRQMQSLNQQLRQQVRQQAPAGSPALAVGQVVEAVERLRAVLPVLTERMAQGMLHPSERLAGVRKQQLVDVLAPFIDENYVDVKPRIAELALVVGQLGRNVLDSALQQVRRERRARGAGEVATLDALLQIHRSKQQLEHGDAPRVADEQGDLTAVLEAYREVTGRQVEDTTIGGFGLSDVGYLREIKAYLKQRHPELADPLRAPAHRYYGLVVQMLEAARELGMGPLAAEQRWEEKQRRARTPNVLYRPMNGRGGLKWGGVVDNVKREVTAYQSVPVQGPVQLSETRELTEHGYRVLQGYQQRECVAKFGAFPVGPALEAKERDLQRVREELLSSEPVEGQPATWRMRVSSRELGYEMEEVRVQQDSPDRPYLDVLGQATVSEVLQQLADFMEGRDGKRPGEGDIGHLVP